MATPITYITNADIYTPETIVRGGTIAIQDGRILRVYAEHTPPVIGDEDIVIDAEGRQLVPGLIDVHVHGGGGFDAMSGRSADIEGMCAFHASHGTTALLVTTLTDSPEKLRDAVAAVAEAAGKPASGADVLGIHLEGPYFNEVRTGAQNPAHLRAPDLNELQDLHGLSGGRVRLLSIAPELEGAEACVRWATEEGITVSIGHSDAKHAEVKRAIEWGASHVTHLFNGMRPLHHREPGVAGAALMHDELTVELICDGVHVHEELIPWVIDVKPQDKVVCITDCMAAAGLPDGEYRLGDLPVRSIAGQVHLIEASGDVGALAGSVLTMHQALLNVMRVTGKSLFEVLPYFTVNPAKEAGEAETKGSIQPGKDADFLLLDEDLRLVATYVRGTRVYARD